MINIQVLNVDSSPVDYGQPISNGSSHSSSVGVIVGPVISILVVLAAIVAFFVWRRHKKQVNSKGSSNFRQLATHSPFLGTQPSIASRINTTSSHPHVDAAVLQQTQMATLPAAPPQPPSQLQSYSKQAEAYQHQDQAHGSGFSNMAAHLSGTPAAIPTTLPPGWELHFSEGSPYYYCPATGQCQWEVPQS